LTETGVLAGIFSSLTNSARKQNNVFGKLSGTVIVYLTKCLRIGNITEKFRGVSGDGNGGAI
jgi:hypothetical protein